MAKLEIYKDIDNVPPTTDYAISPGRQLGIGFSLEKALAQPHGLSPMSTLNVLAGAIVAEATGCELMISGNKEKSYPQGASELLDERYPRVYYSVDEDSVHTLDTARNLGPRLSAIVKRNRLGFTDIVVASDERQGVRLASFFSDLSIAIRGVAVAHRIVMGSSLPEDQALVEAYKKNWWKRIPENVKQAGLGRVDPHGTRTDARIKKHRA